MFQGLRRCLSPGLGLRRSLILAVLLASELTQIRGPGAPIRSPFLSVAGESANGSTVDHHILTVSPVTSLSPDGRCRTGEAGGLRAAAGAWSGRVPDQQERRPAAVLCSTPRALAGTPWAPNASRTMDGDGAHSRRRPWARTWLPSPVLSVPLLLLVLSVPPDSKDVHLTGLTGSQVGGGQEQGHQVRDHSGFLLPGLGQWSGWPPS